MVTRRLKSENTFERTSIQKFLEFFGGTEKQKCELDIVTGNVIVNQCDHIGSILF